MTLNIEEIGPVTLTEIVGSGAFGNVYATTHPGVVVKVSIRHVLCNKSTILQILDGLEGFTPRVFDITTPMSEYWALRVIAMERVGDLNWADLGRDVPIRDMFARFSSLLRSLKLLHSRGFTHKDLKRANIRVQSDDPTKVWVVDFGLSGPSLNPNPMIDLENVMVAFSPTRKCEPTNSIPLKCAYIMIIGSTEPPKRLPFNSSS